MWDFANILLTGPCNRRCPCCIGRRLRGARRTSTLESFPLPGLEAFARALVRAHTRQVSLTGTDTEPQLYRHQERLIGWLRGRIPGVRLSLHTNGTRVLDDPALFNRYDRATISLPSFDPPTCLAMTGSPHVLDLERIVAVARIPLKISTLLTRDNEAEIPAIVEHCRRLGLRRLVLRKLYGGSSPPVPVDGWSLLGHFGGNRVYDAGGIEVTVWDFEGTHLRCLNLMPDGSLRADYLLARPAGEARRAEGPLGANTTGRPQFVRLYTEA